jgi:hypothetical protein
MKRILIALLVLPLVGGLVFAEAPDIRISDNSGNVLNINSDGTLPVSFGSTNVGIGTTVTGATLVVGKSGTSFSKTSIVGPGDLGVTGSVEVDKSVYVDTALYLTHSTLARFYIRQPDGGCSSCGVDAAGTTWSCVSMASCGPGM